MLDKVRAHLLSIQGGYNYCPCGLGRHSWKSTGLYAQKFKDCVPAGATVGEFETCIRGNAVVKDKLTVLRWHKEIIALRLCDLNGGCQGYLAR